MMKCKRIYIVDGRKLWQSNAYDDDLEPRKRRIALRTTISVMPLALEEVR